VISFTWSSAVSPFYSARTTSCSPFIGTMHLS